jgi:hypothetical protein
MHDAQLAATGQSAAKVLRSSDNATIAVFILVVRFAAPWWGTGRRRGDAMRTYELAYDCVQRPSRSTQLSSEALCSCSSPIQAGLSLPSRTALPPYKIQPYVRDRT